LGGAGADVGHSLTLDAQGALYLTGATTEGTGFPVTTGAFQPTYGGGASDAFIAKLNPARTGPTALEYVSYLGGSGDEVGLDLLVDAQQQTFITGWTTGQGQAGAAVTPSRALSPGAPITPWGRLNSTPVEVNPSRGFRGLMRDLVQPKPAPTSSLSSVSQLTSSASLSEFPVTANAYDASFNGEKDAFIAQVNMAVSGKAGLVYATYVGGNKADTATAIGVDSLGRLCIAGTTASANYPVKSALANQGAWRGGTDGFVTKFEANPSTLLFSSYLGGNAHETVTALRLDAKDLAYLTGQSSSTDFPLLTPLDNTTLTEEPQAFVLKIQDPVDLSVNLISTETYLKLGEDYTWALTWENAGPDPATEVQLLFEFDEPGYSPSLQYKSLRNISGPSTIDINSCSGSALTGPGGTLTCDVTNVPIAGGQSSAEVTFTPIMDYDFYISANISSVEVDTNPGNNENSAIGGIGTNPFILSIDFVGEGAGRVEGSPGPSSSTFTIFDDNDLVYPQDDSETITLVATPNAGVGSIPSTFDGWSGECASISEDQCIVRLTENRTVSPRFELANQAPAVDAGPDQTITLPAESTLNGTVTDDNLPSSTSLTTTWSEVSGPGTVTFADAAVVDTAAAFSAPGTYVLRLTADDSELSSSDTITVTVIPIQRTLTTTATTSGTITGTGIDCGTDCTEIVDDGTSITLTATAAPNFNFTGWTVSGSPAATCPGISTCTVTLDTNRTVTANFGVVQRTLTVTKTGSGTVTGTGIDCGTDCTQVVDIDSSVTLTATPTANSTFTGWTVTGSPASSCPGTGTCTVTLNTNQTVTATFIIVQRTLTVTKTGNGSGTVTGPGVNCGTDCTETVDDGSQITLTAAPNPSFFFTGWTVSGSPTATCPGTGTCTIILDTNRTVTATFAANQPPVVEAGQPQVVNLPAGSPLPVDVSLEGTITDDGLPPPASLTSLWRLVTGPAVIPNIVNNATPTVSFPAIGSYILELSATDGVLSHADTVTITINDPSAAQVLIPSVVGQTETAAITALTTVGLTRGTITQELNALVPNGSVIRQTPLGGELGSPGTPVNLVISSGTDLLITMSADDPDATPGNGICETSPGNGACSLRAAIQEANAFPGQQTITLPANTYTLTLAGANEDTTATGDLDITDDLVIESSTGNATQVIISGNALDRVFDLPPGNSPNVTLRGLTIQEGMIEGSTGGGLRNAQGTLILENLIIRTNQSNGSGGGLSHLGGTLTLRNTQVTNNTSEGLGGGLQAQNGTVTIDGNSQFRGNSANFGGGLSVGRANVTVTDTQVENNTAIGVGGGIYKFLSPSDLLGGNPTFEVRLSNSTVRNNSPNNCEGNISGCQ
ncbi:MAG: PASTA domain-containing protein, partial [Gammaproteobacteria bacterium]|nr:PASTA domain-containing protein [Gammaproteobacteria bacterium]